MTADEFLRSLALHRSDVPYAAALKVDPDMRAWLLASFPPPAAPPTPGGWPTSTSDRFTGLPVVVDRNMPRGCWAIVDHGGNVLAGGTVTLPGGA